MAPPAAPPAAATRRSADLLAFANALRDGRLLTGASAGGMGIAGGAPGTNAVLESNGPWTTIVL